MLGLAALAACALVYGPSAKDLSDNAAWREACKVSGYSCAWISRPQVVEAPIGRLLGRYKMGNKYILINEEISGNLAYAVRVHEMTHFLQWKHKKWKFTKASKCENEKEAFDVSNAVLRRLGEDKQILDWDTLRLVYGC